MTAPLTDTDLARLADVLAGALLLPADVVITAPAAPMPCMNCPPPVDRTAVAVLTWRPAVHRAPLIHEPCCAACLAAETRVLAAHHPTIEIPAVTAP